METLHVDDAADKRGSKSRSRGVRAINRPKGSNQQELYFQLETMKSLIALAVVAIASQGSSLICRRTGRRPA